MLFCIFCVWIRIIIIPVAFVYYSLSNNIDTKIENPYNQFENHSNLMLLWKSIFFESENLIILITIFRSEKKLILI